MRKVQVHWARQGEVVESLDGQYRKLRIERRLTVRCVNGSRLGRMLEDTKLAVQRAFDVRGTSIHVNEQAIWVAACQDEMIRFYEGNDGLVILVRGAEFLGELFGCEKPVIIRVSRIIELVEQVSKGLPITQRKANGQIEAPAVVDFTERLESGRSARDMAVKRAEFRSRA